MKKLFWGLALLFASACAPQVAAQPVTVTWPLTSGTGWTSSTPSLVTGNPEVVMGGGQLTVFDYWSGQAQRLWAGTSGWAAAPANPGRYLQFDAVPTPGNQLSVTSVSFNHGGAGIAGHVRSEVRYSVDNWGTSTILAPAAVYPHPAMVPFSMAIAPPPVPSGGKFSLRIYPYTVLNSVAASPTFASHNSVVINGNSAPGGGGGGPKARFDIRKSTGGAMVAGTYAFTVTCTGPGGPYTGTNPVNVTLPTPGVTSVSVPSNSICGIVETQPTSGTWSPPTFSGTGVAVAMGAPWNAKVGPITGAGGTVTVTNSPGKDDPKLVRFDIRKTIEGPMVPGTYNFVVTCSGPGGPYGPTPVSVTLPMSAVASVSVPAGSICGIVETQPTPGSWSPPAFSGAGVAVAMGAPWNAKVGPITSAGGTVTVTNRPGKDDPKLARFEIRKALSGPMAPGSYDFTLTCNGPGGPYTGPNPVSVTLPMPAVSTVSVPAGSICSIVEAQPTTGTWLPPTFSGNGVALLMGAPWNAKVGPITASGGTVTVVNRPKDDPKAVQFNIRKTVNGPMAAGTYVFTVTCNGPGGPYTGPNPVSVTLPTPGVSPVTVPSGSVCSIVETQPATGTWSPPTFSGNGVALMMGAPWNAKVGPITGPGGTVVVTNNPAPVGTASCPAYIFSANLDVGAMINSTTGVNLNHQTNNGTVEKYCYGDSAGNCATYGGLYEWDEAMGYAAGNNNDLTGARVQGICPAGFHIPSDMEWARYAWCQESSVAPTGPTPLSTFQNQLNFSWMGSTVPGVGPGDKMKIAFGSFTPPWTGTNASGFGALPAGHRTMSVGTYANLGDFTAYWTATPGNTSAKARYFVLDSPSSTGRSGRNMALNGYGMSVRCMKDY